MYRASGSRYPSVLGFEGEPEIVPACEAARGACEWASDCAPSRHTTLQPRFLRGCWVWGPIYKSRDRSSNAQRVLVHENLNSAAILVPPILCDYSKLQKKSSTARFAGHVRITLVKIVTIAASSAPSYLLIIYVHCISLFNTTRVSH